MRHAHLCFISPRDTHVFKKKKNTHARTHTQLHPHACLTVAEKLVAARKRSVYVGYFFFFSFLPLDNILQPPVRDISGRLSVEVCARAEENHSL